MNFKEYAIENNINEDVIYHVIEFCNKWLRISTEQLIHSEIHSKIAHMEIFIAEVDIVNMLTKYPRKSIYDKFKKYMKEDSIKLFENYLNENKQYDTILRNKNNKYLVKQKTKIF